jgi:hypothetical protein
MIVTHLKDAYLTLLKGVEEAKVAYTTHKERLAKLDTEWRDKRFAGVVKFREVIKAAVPSHWGTVKLTELKADSFATLPGAQKMITETLESIERYLYLSQRYSHAVAEATKLLPVKTKKAPKA